MRERRCRKDGRGGFAKLGYVGARVRDGALGPWGRTPSHTETPVGGPVAQSAGLIQCLHTSGAHEAPRLGCCWGVYRVSVHPQPRAPSKLWASRRPRIAFPTGSEEDTLWKQAPVSGCPLVQAHPGASLLGEYSMSFLFLLLPHLRGHSGLGTPHGLSEA